MILLSKVKANSKNQLGYFYLSEIDKYWIIDKQLCYQDVLMLRRNSNENIRRNTVVSDSNHISTIATFFL